MVLKDVLSVDRGRCAKIKTQEEDVVGESQDEGWVLKRA